MPPILPRHKSGLERMLEPRLPNRRETILILLIAAAMILDYLMPPVDLRGINATETPMPTNTPTATISP